MDLILSAIARSPGAAARLSDLAATTGLHKNTVFSLLKTMVSLDYCSQCSETQHYRIGRRTFELARQAEQELHIVDVVRPTMFQLVHRFHESVSLAIPGHAAGIVVATVEGTYGVRGTRFEGQHAPYNASALGKALLMAMPVEERTILMSRMKFERFTSRTIVTVAELAADCSRALERGYALSVAEEEVGASAVAVGLRSRGGVAVGSLAIWGPAARLTRRRLAELGAVLVRELAELGEQRV